MLVLVIQQIETSVIFDLIWGFKLFLVLLGLISDKSGLCRSQEIIDLLRHWANRSWTCQGIGKENGQIY